MWWILKEVTSENNDLPSIHARENEIVLRMNEVDRFLTKNREGIKKYFIQNEVPKVSAGILANLIFSFSQTMKSGDYIIIPQKNIIRCVKISVSQLNGNAESNAWSWSIQDVLSASREQVPEAIMKYVRTPRTIVSVDNEQIFENFFLNGGAANKNIFSIPLDLANPNRVAQLILPGNVTESEKKRLRNVLLEYLA